MLVIPVGKTVQIIEHSEDVIHSFWVPEFLFKRDVIPYGTDVDRAATTSSSSPPTTTGTTSAGAPSCAARTTRR